MNNKENLDNLEDRVAALETKLGDVGVDGSVADRLEALEKRLDGINQRFHALSHLMPLE